MPLPAPHERLSPAPIPPPASPVPQRPALTGQLRPAPAQAAQPAPAAAPGPGAAPGGAPRGAEAEAGRGGRAAPPGGAPRLSGHHRAGARGGRDVAVPPSNRRKELAE